MRVMIPMIVTGKVLDECKVAVDHKDDHHQGVCQYQGRG